MKKNLDWLLLALAVLVFGIGLYMIATEPDGDSRPFAPYLPTGAIATILIVVLARRRRKRREAEARKNREQS